MGDHFRNQQNRWEQGVSLGSKVVLVLHPGVTGVRRLHCRVPVPARIVVMLPRGLRGFGC